MLPTAYSFKSIFLLLHLFSREAVSASRSVDLRAELSTVRHQGYDRNTCSSFAATAAAELEIFRATGTRIELSTAYTFWQGRTSALDSDFLQNAYRPIDGLAGYLSVRALEFGVALESTWPYDPRAQSASTSFAGTPPMDIASQRLPFRFKSRFVPRERMGDDLLQMRQPLVFNLSWYASAIDAHGDFRMPSPTEVQACEQRGEGCQGHVVLLVGYDSETRRFVFRNSWGPLWGTLGYGTLPERYALDLCESCRQLARLEEQGAQSAMSEDERTLILSATQGVAADLVQATFSRPE